MIEIFGIISMVLAVAGVVLNNRKARGCFYLWIVSNTICAALHWQAGIYSLVVRDVVFIVLAVEGLWMWSRKSDVKVIDASKFRLFQAWFEKKKINLTTGSTEDPKKRKD